MGGQRILRVTPDLIAAVFRAGDYPARRVTGGLPPDAVLDGVQYELTPGAILFRFRSAEWEPTPGDCPLPELDVWVSEYIDPASLPADWRAAEKAAADKAVEQWWADRLAGVSVVEGSP